jgi:hypothetical protein
MKIEMLFLHQQEEWIFQPQSEGLQNHSANKSWCCYLDMQINMSLINEGWSLWLITNDLIAN